MELIKFTLNDWLIGYDYPSIEPIKTWLSNDKMFMYLGNDAWCKENKLSVIIGSVDMSIDFCITAPKDWVENVCPWVIGSDCELPIESLTNDFFTPFSPDYESFIGCYSFIDNWNYEKQDYNHPYIMHMPEPGKLDGDEIPVDNIINKVKVNK